MASRETVFPVRYQWVLLAGFLAAVVLAGVSCITAKDWQEGWPGFVFLMMAIHQIEEHILSEWWGGPNRSFLVWVRCLGFDLTPKRALILNCGVGWTLGLLAGFAGSDRVWIPLFILLVESVNGVWHLGQFVSRRLWSPGMVSSLFLTIPAGGIVSLGLLWEGRVAFWVWGLLLGIAIMAHAAFLRSLPKLSTGCVESASLANR